jgi:hypothetical protein
MHVYDSVIVFDKGAVSEPSHRMTGQPSFDLGEEHQQLLLPPSSDAS